MPLYSCLEDALLLEEVSLLLSAVEACTARVNPAQASSQLIREGFRNSLSLYKAAYRDLKVGSPPAPNTLLKGLCPVSWDNAMIEQVSITLRFNTSVSKNSMQMLRCQQELPMPVELEGLSQTGYNLLHLSYIQAYKQSHTFWETLQNHCHYSKVPVLHSS